MQLPLPLATGIDPPLAAAAVAVASPMAMKPWVLKSRAVASAPGLSMNRPAGQKHLPLAVSHEKPKFSGSLVLLSVVQHRRALLEAARVKAPSVVPPRSRSHTIRLEAVTTARTADSHYYSQGSH